MRLDVQFRHMERSETLEDYALDKVTQAVEGFVHRHDAHVMIWLISDLNRTNRGTPEFKCEIEVRYPKKRDVFISKNAPEMHSAIQAAADKLKVLLDEAGKREKALRHEPIDLQVTELGQAE
jgi:ribosome-associated translation inhibitor RaiA